MAAWRAWHFFATSSLGFLIAGVLFALLYAVFLVRPLSQIDEFAALATKWAETIVRIPYMFIAAGRAGDNCWLAHESEQKVRSKETS